MSSEHGVGSLVRALLDRVERDARRVRTLGAAHDRRPGPRAPGAELLGGGGAERVGGTQHHVPAARDEHPGEFPRGGGLAGAVHADDQQHGGTPVVREGVDRAVQLGTQRLGEDVAEELAGLRRRTDGAAGELDAQRLDQLAGHLGAEVGLQEGRLDVFPRLLVELTGTEQAEQALPEP